MPSAWVACSQYLAVTAVEPLTSKRDFLGWEPAFETSRVEHEQVSDVGSREGARVWPILGLSWRPFRRWMLPESTNFREWRCPTMPLDASVSRVVLLIVLRHLNR